MAKVDSITANKHKRSTSIAEGDSSPVHQFSSTWPQISTGDMPKPDSPLQPLVALGLSVDLRTQLAPQATNERRGAKRTAAYNSSSSLEQG